MEPNEETGAAQAAALPTDPPDPNDNGSPLGGPGKQIPAIALGVNVDEPQSPMGHKVILTKDESGWIVAECPELPGCVSQGRDEAEALANIREAIAGWLCAQN